ncbi:MAG: ABC transporter ATP-binding protein, partial [Synergistaceae bacterium]|nr:ABC transporter ATP-binding protein [Synergistaceae bacterium]
MELLEVKELSRNFGGINAVDSLSFEAKSGIVTGIIGPNGAGKTTVFNLITGVYKPTGGQILFDGQNCAGQRPDKIVKTGISRTFQNIRLFKRCTCLENVLTPILQRKKYNILSALVRFGRALIMEREATEEAMSVLSVMGLAGEAKRVSGTLPYGLQRKLEIARALAAKPKLLLLDEPAAGMNPEETLSLVELISGVRSKFGLTILLIEHHMDLVMNICDHIVVMESGRLLFRGTPNEVRHNEKVIEAYL